MATKDTKLAESLSQACQRVLAGHGGAIQGAVLADLVSLWLAGHIVYDDAGNIGEVSTAVARQRILADWLETVRDLVPESEKEIRWRTEPRGRG